MAIIGALALTFADWAKRTDPDGTVAQIIELLSQANDVIEDALAIEANNAVGHTTTVRTGLPTATWRLLNYGVATSKSTTAKITDSIGMLETYSVVDKALADLYNNSPEFRLSEDLVFLESMTQTMASTIFYGNTTVNPERFMGLAPRYSTIQTSAAQTANNVIDAGGTGSTNTSLWVVTWSPTACHMIFPKGGKSGFSMKDKGDVVPALDANNNRYEAYTTHFKWDNGLTLRDWRYVVRVCNIDVTTLSGGSPPNLINALIRAVNRLPTQPSNLGSVQKTDAPRGGQANNGRVSIYANRPVRTWLEIQATNKTNVLLKLDEWHGKPITMFRSTPLRTCDALLSTESRVT